MVNDLSDKEEEVSFACIPGESIFDTDNCVTHYICNERSLFVGDIIPITNVGVRGIGSIATDAGIGTVTFSLTSEDGEKDNITLNNVIYLPDSPKI